jgi:hypothetical protein
MSVAARAPKYPPFWSGCDRGFLVFVGEFNWSFCFGFSCGASLSYAAGTGKPLADYRSSGVKPHCQRSGRVARAFAECPAASASIQGCGVRQQAGRGYRPPPGVRGRGSGHLLAGRHARARCDVLEEPSGGAIAAWPADQVGFLAVGLACAWLTGVRRAGPAGQCTADAADGVHGDLLVGWAGLGRAGRRQAVAAGSAVGGGGTVHHM